MIHIIIADDHTMVRQAIASALEQSGEFKVLAECANGVELSLAVLKAPADVVLLDISMPVMNGFVALDKILQQRPNTKIIALSMHSEQEYVDAMQQAGAYGYVLKDAPTSELIKNIKLVAAGKKVFPNSSNHSSNLSHSGATVINGLTRREREVFHLMIEGRSTRDIAELLAMSIKTAENHRGKVLKKVGVNNTAELIHFAAKHKLLKS